MRNDRNPLAPVILVLALLAGCVEPQVAPGTPPETGPLTAEVFVDRIFDAYCLWKEECHNDTRAECLKQERRNIEREKAAAAAGEWRLSEPVARECLRKYPSRSCETYLLTGQIDECELAFLGTVPDDGPCNSWFGCAAGSCSLSTTPCFPSKCYPYRKGDESCDAWTERQCPPGQTCDGRCIDRVGLGEICKGPDQFAACDGTMVCLFEGQQPESIARCVLPPAGEGESCDDTFCKRGLECKEMPDSSARFCRRHLKLGDSCSPRDSACPAGTTCQYANAEAQSGTCATAKALGGDCIPGRYECTRDGYCDSQTRKCERNAKGGEPCSEIGGTGESRSCMEGSCTQRGAAQPTCEQYAPIGAPCADNHVCVSDAECRDGICQARACR